METSDPRHIRALEGTRALLRQQGWECCVPEPWVVIAAYFSVLQKEGMVLVAEPRHNHDAKGIYPGCPACGTVLDDVEALKALSDLVSAIEKHVTLGFDETLQVFNARAKAKVLLKHRNLTEEGSNENNKATSTDGCN